MSDQGARFATPMDVLQVRSHDHALELILPIVRAEHVQRLVVGLPLNMDDTIGPAATTAIAWGRQLSERAGVPVVFVDERLSSFDAESQLRARKSAGEKLTRARKKQQLDALAAAAFLQAFLDGKLQQLA